MENNVEFFSDVFDLLDKVAEKNSLKYCFSKCAEELTELTEVSLKSMNKKGDFVPKKEKIVEEMGDVVLRMYILQKKLGITTEEIEERILLKSQTLAKNFEKYSEL